MVCDIIFFLLILFNQKKPTVDKSLKKYLGLKIFGIIPLIVIILGMSSCKSHKKVRTDENIYVGEVVEIKPIKKKEKKEITIGERIVEEVKTWIGTPYGYGRSEKGKATDCSGMVVVVYQEIASIKLPRNSAQQADFCQNLKEKDIEPGDLVFFATGSDKKKVSHVGVMIDKEKFIHASGSKGVIMSEMSTPYYKRNFIKYGRVPK